MKKIIFNFATAILATIAGISEQVSTLCRANLT